MMNKDKEKPEELSQHALAGGIPPRDVCGTELLLQFGIGALGVVLDRLERRFSRIGRFTVDNFCDGDFSGHRLFVDCDIPQST